MATFKDIIRGFYVGLWNFCFPTQRERRFLQRYEYVLRKDRFEWLSYHSTELGVATTDRNKSDSIEFIFVDDCFTDDSLISLLVLNN